jgi:CRISPR-associated protein Csb2
VATWKQKLDGELAVSDVEPVLRILAAPPLFVLPPATLGHSRHFMPWFKKGPNDRTLVFDAFLALDPSTFVTVVWPDAVLGEAQRCVFSSLLENLGFLGRAESWCHAQLLADDNSIEQEANCVPLDEQRKRDGYDVVRVLCADQEAAFADDNLVKVKKRTTGRGMQRAIESAPQVRYDPNWHLCIETTQIHSEGWSDPPGSRWIRYARRNDCFKAGPRRRVQATNTFRPQVARFAFDSAVLPLVTDTLPIAEAARYMLMGIYGRLTATPDGLKGKSAIFSGKDAAGSPLVRHEHAYYLPTDEDQDGKLDHLSVVAADGFGLDELKALDSLREIRSREPKDTSHTLRLVLLGLGCYEDYQPFPLGPTAEWVSATPFIVTRHLKKRGVKRDPVEVWDDAPQFIATILREELARWLSRSPEVRDIAMETIKIVPVLDEQGVFRLGVRRLRPIQFKRFRQKRDDDGGHRFSGAFRLTFPRPVPGPICLGHSSHFGMGLFLPCGKSRTAVSRADGD